MKSIVRYPERGHGGNSRYRGNCSPQLIEDLIKQFHVSEICDYMAGSFTTADAANQMGIISHCYDLNRGFDLMEMDIPERSEFTFWHPPYWDIVRYSNTQYSAEGVLQKYGFDPRVNDLSNAATWEDFVKMQNYCTMKQYAALETGGRLAILMGDIKKKGHLYSQLLDIIKPGTVENIVIKEQFNCTSDRRTYGGNFIPICHEYLLILRKDMPLMVQYTLSTAGKTDLRDMDCSTWKSVVIETMQHIGKTAALQEIYELIEGHRKTRQNPNWKAKVRQILNQNKEFTPVARGKWKLNM